MDAIDSNVLKQNKRIELKHIFGTNNRESK